MAVRVLHVCETASGGVATYLSLLAQMPASEVEQRLVLPQTHAVQLGPMATAHVYKAKGRGPMALLRMVLAQRREIARWRPDVVFFHSSFALAGLAALRLSGRRIAAIYCAHGWAVARYAPKGLKQRIVRAIEGRLGGLADAVVNVSESDLNLARAFGYRGRQIVVENAVCAPDATARDDLFAAEPAALHLLFVGRFDRQKGLDLLLAAFAQARQERPDLRLHIMGAAVRNDAGGFSLPQGATFVGWVAPARIDDWYRSADAVIVPSRWEGLPLVIPEALRNGTPVICSTNSGMAALIDEGVTGQSFPLDVNALTAVLTGLDRKTLHAMRPAARAAWAARFRPERLQAQMLSLYQELGS